MALRRACCKTLELVFHQTESAVTVVALKQAPPRWYSTLCSTVNLPTVLFARVYVPPSFIYTHNYSTKSKIHGHEKHKDLYAIMGVSPHATQQQIKFAYYNLSMKYHPDRNKGSSQAHNKFTELTEAYSVLGQYETRRKYDKGLLHQYPRQPQHAQRQERSAAPSKGAFHGSKVKFDFDEFYRAHYGAALRRDREARREKREAKERAKLYSLSNNWQQALIIAVTVSVLLVGWYRYQRQRNRTNFSHDQSV